MALCEYCPLRKETSFGSACKYVLFGLNFNFNGEKLKEFECKHEPEVTTTEKTTYNIHP